MSAAMVLMMWFWLVDWVDKARLLRSGLKCRDYTTCTLLVADIPRAWGLCELVFALFLACMYNRWFSGLRPRHSDLAAGVEQGNFLNI
jgi:hypothetical protein